MMYFEGMFERSLWALNRGKETLYSASCKYDYRLAGHLMHSAIFDTLNGFYVLAADTVYYDEKTDTLSSLYRACNEQGSGFRGTVWLDRNLPKLECFRSLNFYISDVDIEECPIKEIVYETSTLLGLNGVASTLDKAIDISVKKSLISKIPERNAEDVTPLIWNVLYHAYSFT